jgi:hypothetical protein
MLTNAMTSANQSWQRGGAARARNAHNEFFGKLRPPRRLRTSCARNIVSNMENEPKSHEFARKFHTPKDMATEVAALPDGLSKLRAARSGCAASQGGRGGDVDWVA